MRLVHFVFATALGILAAPSMAREKPNIMFILADDLGYSDLGAFGGELETPNLDKLAEQGVRFRQFYNSAKCESTRTSIMSGQYWQETGLGVQRGPTMGEVMKSAGYRTYALGKWHLKGNPVDRGFDRYFGHLSGATDHFEGHESFRLNKQPYEVPESKFYSTIAYTDFALDFLEEGRAVEGDKPFFMYLAHSAPHASLQALPEDIDRFKGKFEAGWDELRRARLKRQVEMGVIDADWSAPERPETIPAWSDLTNAGREFEAHRMAVYAAMVYRMDKEIGRIFSKLAEWGELDNTLVIFMSDNGASPFDRLRRGELGKPDSYFETGVAWAFHSNTPFRLYKRNQHQGGITTGAIASWPNKIEDTGVISDYPAHVIDLLPTFLDAAGQSVSDSSYKDSLTNLPGVSFLSALNDSEVKRSKPLFFQLFDHKAIISDGWKLVSDFGKPWELYNINEDRAETNDLVGDHVKTALELSERWQVWASEKDVTLKYAGEEPQYYPYGSKTLSPRMSDIARKSK